MIEFKIGDIVRVKPERTYNYCITTKDMGSAKIIDIKEEKVSILVLAHKHEAYIGKTYTIDYNNLELIPNGIKLINGDIVTKRNNTRLIVFDGYLLNDRATKLLGCYNEELLHDNNEEYDIIKVKRNGIVIFEREEKTELQIELEKIEKEQLELAKKQKELADRVAKLKES